MRLKDLKRTGRDHWNRLLANPRATRAGRWDWRKARVTTRMRAGHYIKLDLLAAAAHAGNVDLVELLASRGARATAWRKVASLQLAWARVAQLDRHSAARLRAALIEADASPFRAPWGLPNRSAFTLFSKKSDDVGHMLPHHDINHRNINHHTALHHAAAEDRHRVVAQLCAAGARLNPADFDGDTPLDYAVACGAKEAARTLIRFGGRSGRNSWPWDEAPLVLGTALWSTSTHADADVHTRRAVTTLFLCAQRGRVPLPAEMVLRICAHFTTLCAIDRN